MSARKLVRECTLRLKDCRDKPSEVMDIVMYRARAYTALGLPHLALSDCFTYADLTDKPDALRLPATQKIAKECYRMLRGMTDVTMYHVVAPDDGTDAPTEGLSPSCHVVTGPMGRGVVALTAIPERGIIVGPRPPLVAYPSESNSCSRCLAEIPSGFVTPCRNIDCHEEYCGQVCRAAALSEYHSTVCKNTAYREMEVGLYSSTTKDFGHGLHRQSQSILAAMRLMCSDDNAGRRLSGALPYNPDAVSVGVSVWYRRMMACLYPQQPHRIDLEGFLDTVARVASNAFAMPRGTAVFETRSMLNHACDPNCAVQGDAVVATRPISPGTECTLHYYPQIANLPTPKRKVEIERRGFPCGCAVCAAEMVS